MCFCCSLVWTAAPDSAFSVSPSSCDLAPLKSTSFRVTYDPKQLNTLHAAQLECFAYHKVMFIINSKNSITYSKTKVTLTFLNKCLEKCWNKILSVERQNNFMQQILLPLCRLIFLDTAGQSWYGGATPVSTLVCDCQSHRPLLSARQRAFCPTLLLKAPSSGETHTHRHEQKHRSYYISFSHFLCIDLSYLVCPLSVVMFCQTKTKVFRTI